MSCNKINSQQLIVWPAAHTGHTHVKCISYMNTKSTAGNPRLHKLVLTNYLSVLQWWIGQQRGADSHSLFFFSTTTLFRRFGLFEKVQFETKAKEIKAFNVVQLPCKLQVCIVLILFHRTCYEERMRFIPSLQPFTRGQKCGSKPDVVLIWCGTSFVFTTLEPSCNILGLDYADVGNFAQQRVNWL